MQLDQLQFAARLGFLALPLFWVAFWSSPRPFGPFVWLKEQAPKLKKKTISWCLNKYLSLYPNSIHGTWSIYLPIHFYIFHTWILWVMVRPWKAACWPGNDTERIKFWRCPIFQGKVFAVKFFWECAVTPCEQRSKPLWHSNILINRHPSNGSL